jgi:hypothetical protein
MCRKSQDVRQQRLQARRRARRREFVQLRFEQLERRLLLNADAIRMSNIDDLHPPVGSDIKPENPVTGSPYGLTGQGVTLGIWNSGDVLTSHVEFQHPSNASLVRVTDKDGSSGVSKHATGVSGTMIARGADPKAKGAAPAALLWSYDWDDVRTELAAAASSLSVSNHSYGRSAGLEPILDANDHVPPLGLEGITGGQRRPVSRTRVSASTIRGRAVLMKSLSLIQHT